MLNVQEAAEQLTSAGIDASADDVITWIKEGKIKAEMNKRRTITYKISGKDLDEFVLRNQADRLAARLEESLRHNRSLTDQVDLLKTRVNIEKSKVRTLKRLLNQQIEASASSHFHISDLLGLDQETDSQSLKKEFRKLLKALHPDRGGDERLFKVFKGHYEKLK